MTSPTIPYNLSCSPEAYLIVIDKPIDGVQIRCMARWLVSDDKLLSYCQYCRVGNPGYNVDTRRKKQSLAKIDSVSAWGFLLSSSVWLQYLKIKFLVFPCARAGRRAHNLSHLLAEGFRGLIADKFDKSATSCQHWCHRLRVPHRNTHSWRETPFSPSQSFLTSH